MHCSYNNYDNAGWIYLVLYKKEEIYNESKGE